MPKDQHAKRKRSVSQRPVPNSRRTIYGIGRKRNQGQDERDGSCRGGVCGFPRESIICTVRLVIGVVGHGRPIMRAI